MNKNDALDDAFKDGLSGMTFSNREAAWKKLERELDNNNRKKRFAFLLLLCCLLAGGIFTLKYLNQKVKVPDENKLVQWGKPGDIENNNHTGLLATGSNQPVVKPVITGISAVAKQSARGRNTKTTKGNGIISSSFDIGQNTDEAYIGERLDADFSTLPFASGYKSSGIIPVNQTTIVKAKPLVKNTSLTQKKFSVEAVAGSDIFNLNKRVGYYTGIRVSRNLDKGTSISAGINYSFNTLNEKYRLTNKPLQQLETDAQINSLKMLRFPVYFQRQISTSKFALMAGLIPSYILDASVYNVPNSNSGNPALYRKFVLNDINRFNILFGAGLKYAAFKNIAFELSGSYGFTELVKDSYINQSNVNDNFKNIQAGVVFRLK